MAEGIDSSSMLERTFQLVPGVGAAREKELWARGIRNWADFLASKPKGLLTEPVLEAQEALARRDLGRISSLVPSREHWRLYPEFADEVVFLDIEADEAHQPTVVGLLDRSGLSVFIEGKNLEGLPEALSQRRFWVTFDGSVHDVRLLKKAFPGLHQPLVHVDLRLFGYQVQMRGGLKAIEASVGVVRPAHLQGVNGYDAVLLWKAVASENDVEALRFLVEYNLFDVIGLKTVLEHAFNEAVRQLALEAPRLAVTEPQTLQAGVERCIGALGGPNRDFGVLRRIRSVMGGPGQKTA